MRAVRVPFSPARPSRLKNEPGILPAAYIRSSTSTVSGRKSTSRRLPTVAVLRTMVSPWRTTTAPEACLAILPVSNEISLPAISTETVFTASVLICTVLSWPAFGRRPSVVSLTESEPGQSSGRGRAAPPVRPQSAGVVVAPARSASRTSRRTRSAIAASRRSAWKRSRSSPRRSAARPQVRVVDAALVGVERVVEGPERALARGRLGGVRQRDAPAVLGLQGEVAEDERGCPSRSRRALAPRSAGTRSRRRRRRAARRAGPRTWSSSRRGGTGALRRSLMRSADHAHPHAPARAGAPRGPPRRSRGAPPPVS